MIKERIDEIEKNEILCNFIKRILNYQSFIKDKTLRYSLYVSLISSDTLIDKEACKESIECINFLLEYNWLMDITPEQRNELIRYMHKGLDICQRDLENFRKEEMKGNL